jgi:hypothetical protein
VEIKVEKIMRNWIFSQISQLIFPLASSVNLMHASGFLVTKPSPKKTFAKFQHLSISSEIIINSAVCGRCEQLRRQVTLRPLLLKYKLNNGSRHPVNHKFNGTTVCRQQEQRTFHHQSTAELMGRWLQPIRCRRSVFNGVNLETTYRLSRELSQTKQLLETHNFAKKLLFIRMH